MATLSHEAKIEALRRYRSGESSVAIAASLGVSHSTVSQMGRVAGIKRRGMLTDAMKTDIASRYLAGEKTRRLGSAFGVSAATITNVLRERDVRFRHPAAPARTYTLNESVFDLDSEAAAYWSGFLIADGSLTGPTHNVFQMTLADIDGVHLESLKLFLETDAKLYRTKPQIWKNGAKDYLCKAGFRIQVSSKRLCEALAQRGFVHPKKDRFVADGFNANRHFWRGVIDGDGEVSLNLRNGTENYPTIGLVGYQNIIDAFANFAQAICPRNKAVPRDVPPICAIRINGANARILARHLYADCHIALPRKLENAKRMMAQ